MIDMFKVGRICHDWRINTGYRQREVADATGYSLENICAFEHGRNDNYKILLWYVQHGLNIADELGGLDEDLVN